MLRGRFEGLKTRIDAAVDRAIAEQRIVGTVLVIGHEGETIYRRTAGWLDREARIAMREDAIFRMASCTKPIVAATTLAMIDAGLFRLDDNVTDHLPYFTPQFDRKPVAITVRHLLTHTSGLSYDRGALADVDASPGMSGPIIPIEENTRRLGNMRLVFSPGNGWFYSTAIDVLGCLCATINKSTLDEAVQRYVTGPLGMVDTRFAVTDLSRLAVPYGDATKPPVRMWDSYWLPDREYPNAGWMFTPSRIFNPLAPQSGGSGMAGTALDFMTFLEMLRNGGGKVLKPETVGAGMVNQIGDLPRDPKDAGKRFGFFGAVVEDPAATGTPVSPGTVESGGIYGHMWLVDRAAGLTVASFTNTAAEGCNGPYNDELRAAIYG
jgi:CubicO group peptidase (beta-lactamase class C family)